MGNAFSKTTGFGHFKKLLEHSSFGHFLKDYKVNHVLKAMKRSEGFDRNESVCAHLAHFVEVAVAEYAHKDPFLTCKLIFIALYTTVVGGPHHFYDDGPWNEWATEATYGVFGSDLVYDLTFIVMTWIKTYAAGNVEVETSAPSLTEYVDSVMPKHIVSFRHAVFNAVCIHMNRASYEYLWELRLLESFRTLFTTDYAFVCSVLTAWDKEHLRRKFIPLSNDNYQSAGPQQTCWRCFRYPDAHIYADLTFQEVIDHNTPEFIGTDFIMRYAKDTNDRHTCESSMSDICTAVLPHDK